MQTCSTNPHKLRHLARLHRPECREVRPQNTYIELRSVLKYIIPTAVVAAVVAAWFLFKPIRALFPDLANVRCYDHGVCVDDPTRLAEAMALRLQASTFIEHALGKVDHAPRVIFCTTSACEKWFGFRGNAAYSLGNRAVVVASRGWQPYFVQHELIHCVQVERIGGFRMWLSTPQWLIEGMAYSMSADPRRPLQPPWEGYRSQYEEWAKQGAPEELWLRARNL